MVQSYRDLPILINQWANVVRGKCAPACFCARRNFSGKRDIPTHATAEEAREETMKIAARVCRLRRKLHGHASHQRGKNGRATFSLVQ